MSNDRLVHTHIFIMGMKHSGKTSVGGLLASRLNRMFLDTDHLIEELYKNGRISIGNYPEGNCPSEIGSSRNDEAADSHIFTDEGFVGAGDSPSGSPDRARRTRSHSGAGCREIYTNHGKAYFQSLEAEVAEQFRNQADSLPPVVLALGGGIIENKAATVSLRDKGMFIYLEEEPEVLFKRIEAGGIPPFLSTADPFTSFLVLYEKRTKRYRALADRTLCVHERTPNEVATELASLIKEDHHAG